MATTTTGQLIRDLHDTYGEAFGLSRAMMRALVLDMLDTVRDTLAEGDDVRLQGLGTLHVVERTARPVIFGQPNPRAGETTRQVTFRDAAALRDALNEE